MKGETAAYKKNDPARNKIGQGLIMKIYGGEGGIRTLDELLTHTRVPVVQLCTVLFILYNMYILYSFSAVQIEQKNTR